MIEPKGWWRLYDPICKEVAYYYKQRPFNGQIVNANDVMFLDGTQPKPGDLLTMNCPSCGRSMDALECSATDATLIKL